MPDSNVILIFDQNDGSDHFLIFTPFLRLIVAIYRETLLRSYRLVFNLHKKFFKYCSPVDDVAAR